MDLTPFKCYACSSLPDDDVFICSNKHIYCIQCAKDSKDLCRCACDLNPSSNPLESALLNVNTSCVYKPNGCTWKFAVKDLKVHLEECKYRPFVCVGNKMSVWECSWKGLKYQVIEHFKESHSSRKIYAHSEEVKIPFIKDDEKLFTVINLIDAFNKTFVFYYESNYNTGLVSMIIFLLGRKQDAKKYLYELEIMDPKDKCLRIKFTQACYSDTEDIFEIIKAGKCVSIPQNVMKNYVSEDAIHFRFRMNKRDLDLPTKSPSGTGSAKKVEATKSTPSTMKNQSNHPARANKNQPLMRTNNNQPLVNNRMPNNHRQIHYSGMRNAANFNTGIPKRNGNFLFWN